MSSTIPDITITDLAWYTELIHRLRPDLNDKIVLGVESPTVNDMSIVFHLYDCDRSKVLQEPTIYMLSSEYILDYISKLKLNK